MIKPVRGEMGSARTPQGGGEPSPPSGELSIATSTEGTRDWELCSPSRTPVAMALGPTQPSPGAGWPDGEAPESGVPQTWANLPTASVTRGKGPTPWATVEPHTYLVL